MRALSCNSEKLISFLMPIPARGLSDRRARKFQPRNSIPIFMPRIITVSRFEIRPKWAICGTIVYTAAVELKKNFRTHSLIDK